MKSSHKMQNEKYLQNQMGIGGLEPPTTAL